MKIYHNSRKREYRDPFGAAVTGSEVTVSIDINEGTAESVRLMVWRDEEVSPRYHVMSESDAKQGRYSVTFKVPEDGCLLWYAFEIETEHEDERQVLYYGNNEDNLGGEGHLYPYSPECYQITVYKPFEAPDWYKDGIVYQIFPDRFARDEEWKERCERVNEHINARRSDIRRTIEDDWNKPAYYVRDDAGNVVEWPIYGGSFKGIEANLEYIKSLGASAIYLNPIFEATSNHRYDTADYMKPDPSLGTEEDFKSLADSAANLGIKLILDGVFSHTGADSIYFDIFGNYSSPTDAGDADAKHAKGAWENKKSPYRSWFKFDDSLDSGYKSWWGVADLPEVNEDDESYREFILGEDGVVAHWLRMGASGWRLDVADELPDSFIEETRTRVKGTKADGLLIGEVWEDASNKISYDERRKYLFGDELDGTMNYPLRDILLDYVNYGIDSGMACDKIMNLAENYPRESFYAALNLIGSHDRERILTAMAVDEDADSAVRKVKLLSTLQYALPGVPCIYYGDEAGLAGSADPVNRSGFPWGRENLDLEYHYRMLGLIYDEHPALKDGEFSMLSGSYGIPDDIFAFIRKGRDIAGNEETLLVLTNRSYGDNTVDLSKIDELKGGYALELLTSTEMDMMDGSLGVIHMDRLSEMIISIRAKRPVREDPGRQSGVICHISSLGKPVLGAPAREFVDFLADAGFGIWQVLPLNPAGTGGSPYSSYAAFAGDPRFINSDEIPSLVNDSSEGADSLVGNPVFEEFRRSNAFWLKGYASYRVISEKFDGAPWYEWPDEYKFADAETALKLLDSKQLERVDELCMEQYYFFMQWNDLKEYANSKGVRIMGDLPMFMAANSADVWANKDIFRMDENGRQSAHAGVPPDPFSDEGQDWGNPLYDWDELRKTGYSWWMNRMRQCAERFDLLRIDHFRGLSEYYSIPEGCGPKDGCWQHSGGLEFIMALKDMLRTEGRDLKLLAEDLGFLDAGVKNLLKLSGLPGMDVWQFNASDMMRECEEDPEKVAMRAYYTGTHDNNTLAGYIAQSGSENEPFDIIRYIYKSPAVLAMMQLQDVFELGEDARMNVPGVPEGNWTWKIPGDSIDEAFPDAKKRAARLKELAESTGRLA